MITHRRAMSSAERQRRFCERHPHYYRDRHRRQKAEAQGRAFLAQRTQELPAHSKPLALPAPTTPLYIELPLFASLHAEG